MICAWKQTDISRNSYCKINQYHKNEFIVGGKFCLISVCFKWYMSKIFVMNPLLENILEKEYFDGSSSSSSNVYITRPIEKHFSTDIG